MPARCDAAKIRARMADRLMTPTQLSDASGLSISTINRILHEKDYRTSDATLNLICRALGCSQYDLLRDDAISDMIHSETAQAITGVVAAAVTEAVTVVADSVTPPDVTPAPQEIAKAVPPLEVTTPPVLDVASYIEYIRTTTEDRVAAIHARLDDMRRSRDLWRVLCIILMIALVAFACYFAWEILHPDCGLTNTFRQIYDTTL